MWPKITWDGDTVGTVFWKIKSATASGGDVNLALTYMSLELGGEIWSTHTICKSLSYRCHLKP